MTCGYGRAGAHHDDPVGQEDGFLDHVGDDDDALERERQLASAAGPEAVDLAAQAFGGEDVQGAERLVHAEQFGPAGQGAGDADALLHSATEFLGIGLFEIPPVRRRRCSADALAAFVLVRPRPLRATECFPGR
jgi:hypothetical protein